MTETITAEQFRSGNYKPASKQKRKARERADMEKLAGKPMKQTGTITMIKYEILNGKEKIQSGFISPEIYKQVIEKYVHQQKTD